MKRGIRYIVGIAGLVVGLGHVGADSEQDPIPQAFLVGHPGQHWAPAKNYPRSFDVSAEIARGRALELMAWERRVRLHGERLFGREVTGDLVFRGEQIELAEVDTLGFEPCQFDTLKSATTVWVVGDCNESTGPPIVWGAMPARRPEWLSVLPEVESHAFAVGIANRSFSDAPGSWHLATYRALIELGFSVRGTIESAQWHTEDTVDSAEIQRLNLVFEGFHAVGRWADEKHVYVLGSVPLAGVNR